MIPESFKFRIQVTNALDNNDMREGERKNGHREAPASYIFVCQLRHAEPTRPEEAAGPSGSCHLPPGGGQTSHGREIY